MKAEPQVQALLLQLQGIDTDIDRLEHRQAQLPEIAELASLVTSARVLADRLTAIAVEVGDLEREQRRADNDVEMVRLRALKDAELLDSGSITDPKQLTNLQSEIASLARRQSDLEDVELEVLERLDEAQKAQAVLLEQQGDLTERIAATTLSRDAAFAEISAAKRDLEADRQPLLDQIPADLLALYQKLRTEKEGIGAAPLYRGRCEGCRIELTPVDIARLREAPLDEVMRCEECRRILVRTDESGL